ncbi:MAG: squalene/phytoene synthase family protein [candidate division WOR-3 bacterium]|nr:MAG: squalene/phytoene synthase family protein [candidate division WOR-3 bacterium]
MSLSYTDQIDKKVYNVRYHNWVTFILARLYCCRHDRYYSHLLYTYLRGVDDYIDTTERSPAEKKRFLTQQRKIITDLYAGKAPAGNSVIVQIVHFDRAHDNMLRPFIMRMMDIFTFDSERQHKNVTEQELLDYSLALGSAYTQLLIRFIEPRYHVVQENVQLAHACHLSHMLRDLEEDLKLGYINIAKKDLEIYHVDPNIQDDNFRKWLRDRIVLIREKFKKGIIYLDTIPILRIKIIARLYCFRYEAVLQQIEDADYRLLGAYDLRMRDIVKLVTILISTVFQHTWSSLAL